LFIDLSLREWRQSINLPWRFYPNEIPRHDYGEKFQKDFPLFPQIKNQARGEFALCDGIEVPKERKSYLME
jgi:hypothetical protein